MTETSASGLVADDAEYIAFQPVRYFSGKQLKLRFKGNIETKEYMTKELLKGNFFLQFSKPLYFDVEIVQRFFSAHLILAFSIIDSISSVQEPNETFIMT